MFTVDKSKVREIEQAIAQELQEEEISINIFSSADELSLLITDKYEGQKDTGEAFIDPTKPFVVAGKPEPGEGKGNENLPLIKLAPDKPKKNNPAPKKDKPEQKAGDTDKGEEKKKPEKRLFNEGDPVKIKATGEEGVISKVNGDGTYEVKKKEILAEGDVVPIDIEPTGIYSGDDLVPLNADAGDGTGEGQGEKAGEDDDGTGEGQGEKAGEDDDGTGEEPAGDEGTGEGEGEETGEEGEGEQGDSGESESPEDTQAMREAKIQALANYNWKIPSMAFYFYGINMTDPANKSASTLFCYKAALAIGLLIKKSIYQGKDDNTIRALTKMSAMMVYLNDNVYTQQLEKKENGDIKLKASIIAEIKNPADDVLLKAYEENKKYDEDGFNIVSMFLISQPLLFQDNFLKIHLEEMMFSCHADKLAMSNVTATKMYSQILDLETIYNSIEIDVLRIVHVIKFEFNEPFLIHSFKNIISKKGVEATLRTVYTSDLLFFDLASENDITEIQKVIIANLLIFYYGLNDMRKNNAVTKNLFDNQKFLYNLPFDSFKSQATEILIQANL